MWARVIEFMLSCFLAISPFIFAYPDEARFLWWNDLTCSSLIAFFALICYYRPLRKMHLCQLAIALYLIALSYILKDNFYYAPLQNYMVLGLLLLIVGLVPTDANKPPTTWAAFYDQLK